MELSLPLEVPTASSECTMSKPEVWSSSLKVEALVSQVTPIECSASNLTRRIQTWSFPEVGTTTSKCGISDNLIQLDLFMDLTFVVTPLIYMMDIY